MPINDNNPERKNLVILGISIILFYLADGHISDQVIRLQVINVTFKNPSILVNFIWILLIWFIYRYWLIWQKTWKKPFAGELSRFEDYSFIIYNHLVRKFKVAADAKTTLKNNKHWFMVTANESQLFSPSVEYISNDDNGKQIQQHKNLDTFKDKIYLLAVIFYLTMRRPTISTYFTPYLIAFFAIFLAA